jgi:hypothetical protein
MLQLQLMMLFFHHISVLVLHCCSSKARYNKFTYHKFKSNGQGRTEVRFFKVFKQIKGKRLVRQAVFLAYKPALADLL